MLFILCLEFYFFISPFQITLKVIYNLRVVVVDKSKFAKLRQYKKKDKYNQRLLLFNVATKVVVNGTKGCISGNGSSNAGWCIIHSLK